MNNMDAIANKIRPYVNSSGITVIYVSTDACEVLPILRDESVLGFNGNRIVSPCEIEESPERGRPEDTLRLLAEIEMMRHGKAAKQKPS